jgi:hypothetical protein
MADDESTTLLSENDKKNLEQSFIFWEYFIFKYFIGP